MKEKAVKINVKTNKTAVNKEHEEGPVIEVASSQVPDPVDLNNEKADNGRVQESTQGLEISEGHDVEMVVEKEKQPETPSIEVVGRVETEEGFDSKDSSPVKIEVQVDLHEGHKAKVSISVADAEVLGDEGKDLKNVTRGLEELNVKDKDE